MDISKLRSDSVHKGHKEKVEDTRAPQQSIKTQGLDSTSHSSELADSENASALSKPEKVNWSSDAQLASEGLAQAKSSGDIRADKVAALKEAIQKGTYHVDSKKLADKMIQASLEEDLLTRKS